MGQSVSNHPKKMKFETVPPPDFDENLHIWSTVGAKEMFTLLKQQKIFLAKQGIKFHISLSLLSAGGV